MRPRGANVILDERAGIAGKRAGFGVETRELPTRNLCIPPHFVPNGWREALPGRLVVD